MKKIILSTLTFCFALCTLAQEVNRSKILIKAKVDPDSMAQAIEAYLMDSLNHEILSVDDPIVTDSIEVATVSDTTPHWFFPDDIINYTVVMRHEVHFKKDRRDRTVIFIHSYVSDDPSGDHHTQKKIKQYGRKEAKVQISEIKENLFSQKN